MVTPIEGRGTAEAEWLAWDAMASWPELKLDAPGPPLVVAPHPDDEILGVAGMMTRLGAADLVAVTDGEASHPDSTVFTPAELAAIRRDETAEALRRLGLAAASEAPGGTGAGEAGRGRAARVHRLGQADGGIDEAAVAAELTRLLAPGQWCVATWREDGHPDHEAVGRAAARACAATGARLLEYPVWMWHWAGPGDPRVPWQNAYRIPLLAADQDAKAAAIAAFPSQIAPLGPAVADAAILPPHVLARFTRTFEVVFA